MLKTKIIDNQSNANLDINLPDELNFKYENKGKYFDSTKYSKVKAEETLKKIKQLIIHQNLSKNKDDLEDLANYFKNKLSVNKNNLELTIGLGNCLEQLQKLKLLKELYSKFNENIKGSEIVKKKLADIFYKENNYIEAKRNYDFCLTNTKYKNSKDIYIRICFCLYNQKKFIKGSIYVSKCLKYFSNFTPEELLLFGNIILKSKDYKKAIKLFFIGIQTIEKYSTKIDNLAHFPFKKNETFKQEFLKAVQLSTPSFLLSKFYNNIGNAYNKIGNYKEAKKYLIKALLIKKNPYTLNNLAHTYKGMGNNKEAINNLLQATKVETDSSKIYFNLAEMFLSVGDLKNSRKFFDKTIQLDQNHEAANFKKELLSGNFKGEFPKNYLKKYFDDYAETFEKHLINKLYYTVPLVFSNIIEHRYGSTHSFKKILDLGCGTGLCGEHIKNSFDNLIGVDISSQMLKKAKEKSIYSELKCCELKYFLTKTKEKYDLLIAGDVLIYIGNLSELFKLCSNVMTKNARFIFSTEVSTDVAYKIDLTARYSHNFNYIQKITEQNNLTIESCENTKIRMEKNKWVFGKVFSVLKK